MEDAGPGKAPLDPAADLGMSPGVEVKLAALGLLLGLTLLSGLLPVCAMRGAAAAAGGGSGGAGQRRVLSLLSCLAGGVFLATCLLDLLPDYLADMNAALENMKITLAFPLPEFLVAMGFFVVLIMEQLTLACRDQTGGGGDETRALLAQAEIPPPRGEDGSHPHLHVDLNSHSAIRCLALVLSLSLHSVFEGLALGLQETGARVVEICVALSVHKCVVAFSLALKLMQNRLRWSAVVGCVLTFAAMSPLGIGLGIALTQDSSHQLTRAVLEGMATGTFVYVTFMEILPHELGASQHRLCKVIMLILGFSLVTGALFIQV